MWKDLVYGVRALRRAPAFTTAAVLSLALGIGANTAIFSLLDQVVLRSLPVADPERLAALNGSYSGTATSAMAWSTNSGSVHSYDLYRRLRDRVPVFSDLLACAFTEVRIGGQSGTEEGHAEMVSGNYFHAVGVPPALGRAIGPDDDGAPGAHPVVVLSHAFWSGHLGGDRAILNRTVAINGLPFVVIGVAAADFNGLVQGDTPDVFVPLAMQHTITPIWNGLEDRTFSWLTLFARLKPGESLAHAQAGVDVAVRAMHEADLAEAAVADPKTREAILKSRVELRPAAQGIAELREQWEKPLRVLMIMVGLVLLIACANVAGLLVARAMGRQREIAIRLAMGAKPGVLVRQLMLEGVLLALAGAAVGLVFEHWSTALLLRILPRDTAGGWVTNSVDWRMLGYSLGLSMVSAVLFALAPALQSVRPALADTLKDQAANVRGGSARLRRVLVTAQVALSLILVVGAGLFSASAANLINARRGFRTGRLAIFFVDATLIRTGTEEAEAFYRGLLERLSRLPGQAGIAASDSGPYANAGFGAGLQVEGYQANKGFASASVSAITPGYFHTLGIPLRAGREFNDRDTAGAPKAVVVNAAFVKKYFTGQNPLGRHLGILGAKGPVLDREIVGVAADVRTNVRRPVLETVFYPYSQREKPGRLAFYVRAAGDQTNLADGIRRVVREAEAGLPVPEIKSIELRIRESIYTTRLVAALSAAFGILATLLAAIGLYGVIAYAVARRTAEIGVRLAIGALPGDVIRMVLLDAGRMVLAGVVLGVGAAFLLSRYVESQLFGIQAADPTVYAGAAAALIVVGALAAFVPARRASRIDPIRALRYE